MSSNSYKHLKGLYILTNPLMAQFNTLKFGFSCRLQSRIYDYTTFYKEPKYVSWFVLPDDLTISEIYFFEQLVLNNTIKYQAPLYPSEFREMTSCELEKIIHQILSDYNVSYTFHNPVNFKLFHDNLPDYNKQTATYSTNRFLSIPKLSYTDIPYKLDNHQIECIKSVSDILSFTNKCHIENFCGSGKSIIALKLLSQYDYSVIVLPSLLLIDQFYCHYSKYANGYNFLCVCSMYAPHCSTDKNVITNFINNNTKIIILVTYHSLHLLTDMCKLPDFCCFDEAHNVNHNTYTLIDKLINTNFLFMSATIPINNNFGTLAYQVSYKNALDLNICRDFNLVIDYIDSNCKKSIYNSIAYHSLLSGNYKIITYHNTVNSTNNLSVSNFMIDANLLEQSFNDLLNTTFVDVKISKIIIKSITSDTYNKLDIIQSFNESSDDEIFILVSCRSLKEGVDIKNCNFITFCEPKTDPKIIIQNIGRGTRNVNRLNDINNSTVLLPIYDKTLFDTIVEVIDSIKNDLNITFYSNGTCINHLDDKSKLKSFMGSIEQQIQKTTFNDTVSSINNGQLLKDIGLLRFRGEYEIFIKLFNYCFTQSEFDKELVLVGTVLKNVFGNEPFPLFKYIYNKSKNSYNESAEQLFESFVDDNNISSKIIYDIAKNANVKQFELIIIEHFTFTNSMIALKIYELSKSKFICKCLDGKYILYYLTKYNTWEQADSFLKKIIKDNLYCYYRDILTSFRWSNNKAKHQIFKLLNRLLDLKNYRDIFQLIIDASYNNKTIGFDSNKKLFCFNNVAYDFTIQQFRPYIPEDYVINHCGYDWVEPTFEQINDVSTILKLVIDDDSKLVLLKKLFMSCLVGACPISILIFKNYNKHCCLLNDLFLACLGNFGCIVSSNISSNKICSTLNNMKYIVFRGQFSVHKFSFSMLKKLNQPFVIACEDDIKNVFYNCDKHNEHKNSGIFLCKTLHDEINVTSLNVESLKFAFFKILVRLCGDTIHVNSCVKTYQFNDLCTASYIDINYYISEWFAVNYELCDEKYKDYDAIEYANAPLRSPKHNTTFNFSLLKQMHRDFVNDEYYKNLGKKKERNLYVYNQFKEFFKKHQVYSKFYHEKDRYRNNYLKHWVRKNDNDDDDDDNDNDNDNVNNNNVDDNNNNVDNNTDIDTDIDTDNNNSSIIADNKNDDAKTNATLCPSRSLNNNSKKKKTSDVTKLVVSFD